MSPYDAYCPNDDVYPNTYHAITIEGLFCLLICTHGECHFQCVPCHMQLADVFCLFLLAYISSFLLAGAVFSGKYRDTEVAVKKVNDPKQTELKILRKFTHRNIIKFL